VNYNKHQLVDRCQVTIFRKRKLGADTTCDISVVRGDPGQAPGYSVGRLDIYDIGYKLRLVGIVDSECFQVLALSAMWS
jgi:hypothetical protein